ncbi:MAG: toprim domain-containing protein [Elusimicrobia bacterium]|nr:toprim domain-containing protein [Elusimicrobiota bacterium]
MDIIDQIKEIPIIDVATLLGIEVKRNKAMCFNGHDKQTASLSFTPSKNLFYCFGCGTGGSSIDLVMNVENMSNRNAILWLKDKFLGQHNNEWLNQYKKIEISRKANVQSKAEIDPKVYTSLINELKLSNRGRSYLRERGFSDETIEKFRIKDIEYPKNIFSKLVSQYGIDILRKVGLIRTVEKGEQILEKFIWWDYIILFPFYKNNDVVYIQGRRLSEIGPKYLGLKGISKPLYNTNVIDKLKEGNLLLICEGIPDVLAANEMGYSAVGVLGAHSFNEQWVEMLIPFDVVIVPDNDAAGSDFARKIKKAFLDKGKIVQTVRIQDVKDLSEFYQKNKND